MAAKKSHPNYQKSTKNHMSIGSQESRKKYLLRQEGIADPIQYHDGAERALMAAGIP